MSKKTEEQETEKSEVESLMNVNKFYGATFHFKQPTTLEVRGYFKGFIKVPDYKYHIAELLFVSTDKGPLEEYFSDIEANGKASFYFPFSEKSKNNEELEKIFNEGINDWEKMKEVIDSFEISTFDTERGLMDWLFGFDEDLVPTKLDLDRSVQTSE